MDNFEDPSVQETQPLGDSGTNIDGQVEKESKLLKKKLSPTLEGGETPVKKIKKEAISDSSAKKRKRPDSLDSSTSVVDVDNDNKPNVSQSSSARPRLSNEDTDNPDGHHKKSEPKKPKNSFAWFVKEKTAEAKKILSESDPEVSMIVFIISWY
jgi:hypothetical protein